MAIREYGGMDPIPTDRLIETPEGAVVELAGRKIEFWDAPGHARHHVFIRDCHTNSFFTGDTFGISYRDFDTAQGAYVFVTSSPSQFNPEELKASVRRISDAAPPAVYLTHYAQVRDVGRHAQHLIKQIDDFCEIALAHQGAGLARADLIQEDLARLIVSELRDHGVTLSDAACREVLALDLKLNSDGLVCWLDSLK
jgi:glyoxylase-like metal-dependent hydrolase (beta-lactamase superfamily II)